MRITVYWQSCTCLWCKEQAIYSPFDAVKLPLLPTVEIPSFHVSFLLCSNFEIRKVWYFLVLNGKYGSYCLDATYPTHNGPNEFSKTFQLQKKLYSKVNGTRFVVRVHLDMH